MAYSEKVIEHYENPRNVGTLRQGRSRASGTGLVGAPACGDVMKLQLKISDDGDHRGRQVQDLRLRLGHRLVVAGHRVGQGQDHRPGDGDQEHPDRRGAEPAAGEDPLLGAGRGRHQGAPSPTTRRSGRPRRARRKRDRRRDGGELRSSDGHRSHRQSGRRDQEGGRRSARRRPRGCASASAAAAAPGSRICSSGRTASRGPRTRSCRSRTARVRVFVDPKSFLYLDGSTLELRDVADGPRLQVREPERQGHLRLRRERPVLASAARSGKVRS